VGLALFKFANVISIFGAVAGRWANRSCIWAMAGLRRFPYGFVGIQTVELKPSNTVVPHRDSQEVPICANGSANVEMSLHRASVFTSSNGGA
jgi:hypothetical protein